jgi:hypothetical protein
LADRLRNSEARRVRTEKGQVLPSQRKGFLVRYRQQRPFPSGRTPRRRPLVRLARAAGRPGDWAAVSVTLLQPAANSATPARPIKAKRFMAVS